MRLYSVDDDTRLGLRRALRDWSKAGLLSEDQERTLGAGVATGYRRAGIVLRLGLAAFTALAGSAAIALVFVTTNMQSALAVSITAAVLGAAAFAVATALVRRFMLYRHGVEEALALAAVGLWGVSAGLLTSEQLTSSDGAAWFVAMAATAVAFTAAYRRFGFQYAAVGALYATALLPVAFGSIGMEFTRIFAALVCAGAFVYATGARRRADSDIAHADAEMLRAAAVVGAYVALNSVILVEPSGRSAAGWFKWTTWVVTWLLPFLVGHVAVRERDPLLLRVAIAAGLASLLTNKSYLGWPRHAWDPMLLGVVLVGAALMLRRWLSRGAGGERNGFTARQLLASEEATIQLAGLTAVAVQPAPIRHVPQPADPTFSGGRSGGAGAGGEF